MINKPNVEGIRGIRIGDSFEAIINNFPTEGDNKPDIVYNKEEDIYEVGFMPKWGYWLEFKIKNGIIVEISYNLQYV